MLQNIPKEKILEIVRQGPTFPAKVAKALGGGGDTMLIGAILSTLISSGDLKVSTIKIGGSPLYYVPEQESKLEDFLSYLNEKDKLTFRLLKEEKILQDSLQEPLTRVSLRTIKDFAKSFEIDFNKQKVIFWRFYTLPKDEAILLAKAYIKTSGESIVEKEKEEKEFTSQPEELPKPHIVQESIHIVSSQSQPEKHESAQTVLDAADVTNAVESHKEKHVHATHEHKPHHEHVNHKEHVEHTEHTEHIEHVEHAEHAIHHTKVKTSNVPKQKSTQDFFELIQKYVLSKSLDIVSKEKIKKTEYDLILKNHATNEYIYCKAKDKSSVNEGDLAPALIFAQNKKMTCLFISTGDLTKSAESTLVNQFKGMTFEKIKITSTNSL